jgi:hypothetical protein
MGSALALAIRGMELEQQHALVAEARRRGGVREVGRRPELKSNQPRARRYSGSSPLPVEGFAEVDESYFGGVRKGKRGRGAAGKIPVFGILKRGGKVHTVMIPDVRKDPLLPIIRQKVVPDSIVYTDSYTESLRA